MIFFLLFTFVAVTTALTNDNGPCPTVYPVNNFNFTAHTTGKWYDLARFDMSWTDRADCVSIEYTRKICGISFRVSLIQDGKQRFFEGITPIPINPRSGTVNHVSQVVREFGDFTEVPVSVVDTDYENYSIVYSCQYNQYTGKRTEFSWMMSRYSYMTDQVEKAFDRFIKYSGVIDPKNLIWSGYTRGTC